MAVAGGPTVRGGSVDSPQRVRGRSADGPRTVRGRFADGSWTVRGRFVDGSQTTNPVIQGLIQKSAKPEAARRHDKVRCS